MAGMSRVEDILQAKANNETYDKVPLSRIEELLMNVGVGGSGGGDFPGDFGTDEQPSEHDFIDVDVDDIMTALSTDNDD